ncbi:EVE domain-containing protein [Cardiobacteriaceae bacterium TAE3-ERU3]|nr:EVE domain-containing protein [Cardiobacteriaceae bacterium TAE3-ERU3]
MKSEPDEFSFDDLVACGEQGEGWSGVRNYQARNFMRDMVVGDQVFFYHSSTPKPGIAGIAEVIRAAYPDPSQFDTKSHYFDARSSEESPRWWQVDVRSVRYLPNFVALKNMREEPSLAGMALLQKGNRLSVMPVTPQQWAHILKLGGVND